MLRVFGIGIAKEGGTGLLLEQSSRIDFESWKTVVGAYFDLIASSFDDFAQTQCLTDLRSINVMVALEGQDLSEAVNRINILIEQYLINEMSWDHYQGTEQLPGQEERRVYVTIQRHGLLLALRWVRRLFCRARMQGKFAVYGTGVCRRALCEIKSPPGTLTYS